MENWEIYKVWLRFFTREGTRYTETIDPRGLGVATGGTLRGPWNGLEDPRGTLREHFWETGYLQKEIKPRYEGRK